MWCKRYQHKHSDTLKNALKLFSAGAPPWTPLGKLDALPDPLVGWGFPSSTTPKRLGSASRSTAPWLRFPFLWSPKKSLTYTMQHCSRPFGPCVQTDINVTGLVVKGPRVSICPRAPSRSVTPLERSQCRQLHSLVCQQLLNARDVHLRNDRLCVGVGHMVFTFTHSSSPYSLSLTQWYVARMCRYISGIWICCEY